MTAQGIGPPTPAQDANTSSRERENDKLELKCTSSMASSSENAVDPGLHILAQRVTNQSMRLANG